MARAIKLFKDREEKERLIKQYEEGYTKHPETPIETKTWEKVSSEIFSGEDWK